TDLRSNLILKNGNAIGVKVDGKACVGFPTPSRKLEFFSKTLKDWRWPEHAIPGYIKSHVHPDNIDLNAGEMLLLPTFRLPTLIHTRSGNAKWLYEISNRNPLWINSIDAQNLDVKSDDPDSERIFWEDGGVHQNLTFPVQPDYISGQHCWHQKVRVTKPGPDDKYGDIFVDTNKSHEVYKKWLLKTRPAPGPDNLR